MKRLFSTVFALLLCAITINAFAGEPFEGKMVVTLKSTLKSKTSTQKFDLTVKNNHLLFDGHDKDMPRVLLNNATGEINLLMDGQGQKMAIKLNLDAINKLGGIATFLGNSYGFSEKSTTIKSTGKTKEINGIKCMEYIAKDASYSTTFWATKAIDLDFASVLGIDSKFPELKDMMVIQANGKNLKTGETFTIDVAPTAQKVDDQALRLPAGYQQMDMTQVVDQMMKQQKPEDIKKMLAQFINKK